MSTSPTSNLHAAVAGWRSRIDRRLGQLLPPATPGDGVGAAMRDGVLAPGKRLRPLLMLAAGDALGCRTPALLDAACAVEMVHAASLVLDDMPCMDNARLRRGRPTVHLSHGEDAAVLAAVALLAQACGTAAGLAGVEGALQARVVGVLCEAVGTRGLVRGQYRDLREGTAPRSPHAIAEANDQKTGVLFACALEITALVAGAPDSIAPLRAAATELGQAFQLKDDLDDGSATPLDKDRHQDVGKSTMVRVLGRAEVERRLHGHLAGAREHLQALPGGAEVLCTLLSRVFAPAAAPETAAHVPQAAAGAARQPAGNARAVEHTAPAYSLG